MTLKLRHAHRTIWLALAIALPVGFGTALSMTDTLLPQEPIRSQVAVALPIEVRSVNSPDLTITLRYAPSTMFQLEIRVKTALEVPSAVVQVRQQNTWRTLGLIGEPGAYRFALASINAHPVIRIQDDIHQRTLRTIQL